VSSTAPDGTVAVEGVTIKNLLGARYLRHQRMRLKAQSQYGSANETKELPTWMQPPSSASSDTTVGMQISNGSGRQSEMCDSTKAAPSLAGHGNRYAQLRTNHKLTNRNPKK